MKPSGIDQVKLVHIAKNIFTINEECSHIFTTNEVQRFNSVVHIEKNKEELTSLLKATDEYDISGLCQKHELSELENFDVRLNGQLAIQHIW